MYWQKPVKPSGQDNGGPGQNKIAYNLILTASEKAAMICGELERVEGKRDGLRSVSGIDLSTADSGTIDDIKRQIEELDKIIIGAVPVYTDLISQLTDLQSGVVDSQFEDYTKALTKSSFKQIPMTRMMKHHYERFRGGQKVINVERMRKDCEQAAKGTEAAKQRWDDWLSETYPGRSS